MEEWIQGRETNTAINVVLAPSFLHFDLCGRIKELGWDLAGQGCSDMDGTFTGEVTAEQLKEMGAGWVVVGQMKREKNGFENTEEKIRIVQRCGLGVILCLGENEVEKKSGFTLDVIQRQLMVLDSWKGEWEKVIVSYEPAIIERIESEELARVRNFILEYLSKRFGKDSSGNIRVIFKSGKNANEIFRHLFNGAYVIERPGSGLFTQVYENLCNCVKSESSD